MGMRGGSSDELGRFLRHEKRVCPRRRFGNWQREGRVRVRVARVLERVLGSGGCEVCAGGPWKRHLGIGAGVAARVSEA